MEFICESPINIQESNKSRVCIKCKNENGEPSLYIRKDDPPLCKSCFLTSCMHKFRSAFGKNNSIRNGEHVLLAFSGGPSSTAMLNLSRLCVDNSGSRRVRFLPEVVLISDSNQFNHEALINSLKETGFKYSVVPSEKFTDHEISNNSHLLMSNSQLTAAEENCRWRRNLHLARLARSMNLKYVLVGESASRLATHCLSGIALGRGGCVASELEFFDNRYEDVTFVRPMRDFLANEIALFLYLSGLDSFRSPTVTLENMFARGPNVNSIQRLTENFISSLQFTGFPSTTKAILSAASKTLVDTPNSTPKCNLCHSPLSSPISEHGSPNALDLLNYSILLCRSREKPDIHVSGFTTLAGALCNSCLVNSRENSLS